jgi:tRNA G18 (ribose-2'-O)-methylase SpoU
VIVITSLDDARIDAYRQTADHAALARAGLFVAEGRWVVERLLARRRYRTHSVLVTPTAYAGLQRANAPLTGDTSVFVLDQDLLNQIVGFNIHRGCLALAERPVVLALDGVSLQRVDRIIVLEGVNNPDNVGGIFRSAAAFGVDLVVLGPACGDPLYRKAIRTSMAATLDVPFVHAGDWPAALDALRGQGLQVIALTPDRGAPRLETVGVGGRVALVLGTESGGLTQAALRAADLQARIATTDRVDSLNVAVAASIAMHCCFRKDV